MKRTKLIWIAVTSLVLAACGGNPFTYTINGTAEGIADGDSVYLQEVQERRLITLESTVMRNGKFEFKGRQDTAILRFLSVGKDQQQRHCNFYLENGRISINLDAKNPTVSGTPNNDALQSLNNKLATLMDTENQLFEIIRNETSSITEKQQAQTEIESMEGQYLLLLKEAVLNNLDKCFGIDNYTQQLYYNLSTNENDSILQIIPKQFKNRKDIQHIQKAVEKQKPTQVGKRFIDFKMNNPEGKEIALSNFVGKGKVVLVDFWASWCPPCRKEMPNLVEIYQNNKDKNFEIVGVSLDKDLNKWKQGIEDLNITWPQMSDLKFWGNKGADLYGVSSIPHVILIDANGIIISRGLHGEELKQKVEELLK